MERFSFIITEPTPGAAKKAVAAKLTEVVGLKMLHAEDTAPVQAAADTFVGVLPVDKARNVSVTVAGYVTHDKDGAIVAVQCIVEASLQAKPQ